MRQSVWAYSVVMRGLDPRIHRPRKSSSWAMDRRVKPGDDEL